MADELAGRPIGERIQIIRERTGKSRPVVAGLVGRSAEWLKSIEKGRLLPPRLDMLVRLAEVLGVKDLAELIGDEPLLSLQRRAAHPVVPAMREAIEDIELLSGTTIPDVNGLGLRAEQAWRLWHSSSQPRADVGAVLPSIIRDGRRAVRILDGDEQRAAYAALASAYGLAESVLYWVADATLLALVVDRCMDAAQQVDSPEVLARAAWVVGNVWRNCGREEDAWSLAQDACSMLEPGLNDDSDSTRALWGACQLHSSITAARLGREGDALRCLDAGMNMSTRLPAGYAEDWTLFGKANAELTGVSVYVDLFKSGSALDYGQRLEVDSLPSLGRRTRLWLEVARASAQRKDWTATLHFLQRATSISEEFMRHHPLSRGLTGELVTVGGRFVDRESRILATRLGVTV